ncbi:MAG TPA: hypothetical protein VE078_01175, partial [Thermoanaerobaculia bacterium]|nr:hypothetical protein [Thermoanaerobaculia bacterium]
MSEPAPEPSFEIDSELIRQMRDAGSEDLLSLVREHASRLDPEAVRLILCNPYVTADVIEA